METKFTKGKWKEDLGIDLLGNNDELMQIIVFSKEVNTHNIAHVFGLSQEEVMANALLISKAVEMLEMLKKLVPILRQRNLYETALKTEQLIKEATEI